MEEVDKIIIQSLKEIGCNLEDDIISLKQFKAESVVEAAVRCLKAIQPQINISSTLPPSMSARYKAGTDIAEACIDLGYNGEIGYQTFLYSSETEVRRVFMFLVEKLPKELDKTQLQTDVSGSNLRQRFSDALRQQLSVSWSAPTEPTLQYSFASVPLETGISLPGEKRDCTPQEWREFCVHQLPYLHEQVSRPSQLLPSIITHHARACLSLPNSPTRLPTTSTSTNPATSDQPLPRFNSWMQITASLLYSNKDMPKKQEKVLEPDEESKAESEAVTEEETENEQVVIDRLRERMDQLHADIKAVTSKISQASSEKRKQELLCREKKKEWAVRQKTLELLPDSNTNMIKLQELVDNQAQVLLRLGTQWEKHRSPLVTRLREARHSHSDKASESARQQEKARETREKLRELKEELAVKDALQIKLQEEHSKLDKTVTRTAYTRRILEIIGNIKKQREEIDKIVEDTKQLQRDINIVSDRVDRAFTYADEIIFKDCKQDNASRRVYKMVTQLHSECRLVVAMIEETGATVREIRDLEDQIETERAKDMASKLERITADLHQMRQETATLRVQLARAGAPS